MSDPRAGLGDRFNALKAPRQPKQRARRPEIDEEKAEAGPVVRNTYTLPKALDQLLMDESDRLNYELKRIERSNVVAAALHLTLTRHMDELEALLKPLPR